MAQHLQDKKVPFHKVNDEPVQGSDGPMATIQDDDELLLARIGYQQVSIELRYQQ